MHIRGGIFFEKADICDLPALKEIFGRYGIDAVCHFAAESHVDRSIKRPDSFIQTNILGTFNLLEVARAAGSGFRLFHHISTDEVYGSLGKDGLFTEETPYRPNSPYSASKASSDHLVRAYHETYGLPTTISNCSNNYGPYQFPEKLIPLIVLNAVEGKPLPVYGDGRNVRDWLYVTDHCEAIRTIMEKGRRGETYNIGGHAEMENIAIVEMICDLVDELASGGRFPEASDHVRCGPARSRPAICHRFLETARRAGLVSRRILRLGSQEDRPLVSGKPGLERSDPKRGLSVLDQGAVRHISLPSSGTGFILEGWKLNVRADGVYR